MKDKQIFKLFCEQNNLYVSYDNNYRKTLENTTMYQMFKLKTIFREIGKSIKKEITRDSVWDNGCRLVLFGAIPVIIVTIIYSLVEYFA